MQMKPFASRDLPFVLVLVFFVLIALASVTPAHGADSIGFRTFSLPATENGRALEVAVWYPADSASETSLAGDSPIFIGLPVGPQAHPAPGRRPLVVISHGYGGNWANQMWLARELVLLGYVVAAPNHPGTTSRDMHAPAAAALWERPRDISHAIDALTTAPAWSGMIDPDRIAVIGHSLGGWTALEVAGGRFDPDRFTRDCRRHGVLAACRIYEAIGAGRDAASNAALGQSRLDTRVKAVVSMDLGFARSFDPASLAAVTAPVLVIAAGPHTTDMPATLESQHLAAELPAATTRYVQIKDAAHFSFLPECKPGAAAMLQSGPPDKRSLCLDGGGRQRAAIHEQVVDTVRRFLSEILRG